MSKEKSLRDALTSDYEIKTPSKDLIYTVADNSMDMLLGGLVYEEHRKEEMQDFLWGRDTIDFLSEYQHKLNAKSFVKLLKKVAPRAYSISSSIYKHANEVHLTIGSVRYESHGRQRKGVTSTWLADMVKEGETICIIESMKMMNQIKSDRSGRVEAVLTANEEAVEFDQPLFTII